MKDPVNLAPPPGPSNQVPFGLRTANILQAIQEATASEPLSLEEEYENQESWRASHDKLTFILCQPAAAGEQNLVHAGQVDTQDRMIGDINFFLYPSEDDDAPDGDCVGEVDIMIAGQGDRGKGLGKAAVSTFLHYIWRNRDAILGEYQSGETSLVKEVGDGAGFRLEVLMAKIKADNVGSIALFKGLGFEQEGDVNYFGEIKMVLKNFDGLEEAPEGFQVVEYHRPSV